MYRSALYVPADHERAMAKAAERGADILIFDLEDGVAPSRKAEARRAIAAQLRAPAPHKEQSPLRLVRINHRDTPFYHDDLAALAACALLDGLMLSKVAAAADVDDAAARLAAHDRSDLPLWCNVETPQGIAHAEAIAAHPRVAGLVAGTNDLASDLRIRRTAVREGLLYSLSRLVVAARACGRIVLDGTFVDLEDEAGLQAEAWQGRMLGFDGKTLIHPKQIAAAHAAFAPSTEDIAEAEAIMAAYAQAMREDKAVTLLNGRMIERLHYDRAKEILARAASTTH